MPDKQRKDSGLDMPLNWDILNAIMLYCRMEDASRISRTCRTLLQSAPRVLLSGVGDEFQAVALDVHSHFPSFHQFMLSERHDCFHLLRRLRLSALRRTRRRHDPEWDIRMALVDILDRTTELEFLGLGNAEILEAEEDERTLLTTLIHLKTLRTLHFENMFGTTFERLKTMEAPLTGIYGTFGLSNPNDVFDPIRALAPFSTSLQVLDLLYIKLPRGDVDVLYPQLTSLSVRLCTDLDLESVVRCFPRLQELRFKLAHWEPSLGQEYIERHRLWNVASQKGHTWPSLRRLHSSVIQLYILAIRCKTECIDATVVPLDATTNGRRLAAVLADARPTYLSLRLKLPGFDLLSLAEWLAPASDGLRGLKLHVELDVDEHDDDPLIEICTMLATLNGLRLRSLDIHVEWERPLSWMQAADIDLLDGEDPSGKVAPQEEFSSNSREFELHTIAQEAAKQISTLQFVAVKTAPSCRAQLFEILDSGRTGVEKTLVELYPGSSKFEEFYKAIMYQAWI